MSEWNTNNRPGNWCSTLTISTAAELPMPENCQNCRCRRTANRPIAFLLKPMLASSGRWEWYAAPGANMASKRRAPPRRRQPLHGPPPAAELAKAGELFCVNAVLNEVRERLRTSG
jgi:hypothetical protein